eukprot:1533611-Prymnesium_polylepis.1
MRAHLLCHDPLPVMDALKRHLARQTKAAVVERVGPLAIDGTAPNAAAAQTHTVGSLFSVESRARAREPDRCAWRPRRIAARGLASLGQLEDIAIS